MPSSIQPPKDQFEPFDSPLEDRWVNHLFRRAAFGPSVEQLDQWKDKKPSDVLDWLMDYDPADDPMAKEFESLVGFINTNSPQPIQEWWLHRMLISGHPMQEKIALFWHGRFATSLGKIEQPMLMHQQLDLFRRMGMGNYRKFLVALGHDPAMLIWLDGRFNRKGKPNENYGRELMELFTLGIGNYTEQDVKELARCFTGWQLKEGKPVFTPEQFDSGEKKVLGQTGKFDSESAVDVILDQPAAPKFLARKVLAEFVHPQPTDEQVEHYASRLLANKWELKPVFREILSSRMFFSDWAYRSKIKSPVELVIGACRAIGGIASRSFLREQTSKMGQTLLYPPSVKGWDGQEMWINANTVLLRFNVGLALAEQRNNEFAKRSEMETWLSSHNIRTPAQAIDHFARVLLDGNLAPDARQKLLDYMNRDNKGKSNESMMMNMMATQSVNPKLRGMLHLMMSMPEYQLA